MTSQEQLALLTLEAMRLGVVPETDLSGYTVGREKELSLVRLDLESAHQQGSTRAFLGEYGTGKTHLLELIREEALSKNFLVARVMLNPEETAPSHPKRVYRELIRSLEYPGNHQGTGVGLEPLLRRAAESDAALEHFQVLATGKTRENLDDGAHLYLTAALRYFRALHLGLKNGNRRLKKDATEEEKEYGLSLLMNWIEGHPTISNTEIDEELRGIIGRQGRVYSLLDYRPWARIYGYILSGLAVLSKKAGYAGLVVLIDEAEFYSLLSSQNREYARILFKALAFASIGGNSSHRDTENTAREFEAIPFSKEELELGGIGILQDLPPRYSTEGGLYTVFAMTPNADGLEALRGAVPEEQIAELTRLALEDYQDLVRAVSKHYRSARGEADLQPKIEAALSKVVAGLLHSGYIENPRQAMKFVVEFLDLLHFRPDDMAQVVGDLREMYA